jgi:hypothetical protein
MYYRTLPVGVGASQREQERVKLQQKLEHFNAILDDDLELQQI